MIRKWIREIFLLHPGERRALILVTMLLILSLAARWVVQSVPPGEMVGMEAFSRESKVLLEQLTGAAEDTLKQPAREYGSGSRPGGQKQRMRHVPVNINAADSADLLPLPGIGPVFAGRIVKYRNLLGGFVCPQQLAEVYGLSRQRADALGDLITVDSSLIKKVSLNRGEFGLLLRHPYLEYEDVCALVRYRDVSGPILDFEEIRIHALLADSILEKVAPYLDFSR